MLSEFEVHWSQTMRFTLFDTSYGVDWVNYQSPNNCKPFNFGMVFLPCCRAPSTGGFERTNRQDSRFACVSTRRARYMDVPSALPAGARQGSRAFFVGLGSPYENPRSKPSERRIKAAWGVFSFGYFSLDKHKFVRNEFEQPIGWPAGRKPWMVFVAKVPRLSGRDPISKHPSR